MSSIRISVVIPVFNRQLSCEDAVRSVLNQRGCDLEILIIDDASVPAFSLPDDLTGDPRIRVIRQDTNRGQSAARNTGIQAATYPWIAFLDSDDKFIAEKLALQAQLADPTHPLDVIATGFTYSDRKANTERSLIPIEARDVAIFCSGCWHCPGSTALVHRDAFATVGLLDERLRRLEDIEWFIRLGLKGGTLRVVPQPLAWIDVGANASIENVDRAAATIRADYIENSDRLSAAEKRNLGAYLALERAAARFKKGRWIAMLPHLARSFWLRPRISKHLENWWNAA
ncbi:MAG: glycosyltransferase family 2 protein [Rhabdaerophilum sp.]